MTRRSLAHALATALASTSLATAAAQAPAAEPPPTGEAPSQRDVTLIVEKGQAAQLRLAFPALTAKTPLGAGAREAVADLDRALREDLERSGIFVIQGPAELAVAQATGDLTRDFELYRSLGNEVVLLGDVLEEAGRLVLEGRLYDLSSGQSILGKRYRGGFELARRMAHSFADEIILYFTGRRGIALTSIAFTSDRSGHKEVWLMDYDGRNPRPITGHKSISMAPDWSPAGDAIAYVSFFDGAPGVYYVDLASGLKRPIVTDGSYNGSPSFSPDGRRIVFSRSVEGNAEIFVANRDGSGLRRLTHSPGIDTNPAWSPDGRQIAFTSSRAGNPHIYSMDVEGTNLRRISFEGDYNDGAAWSPDGSRLTYASRRGREFRIVVTDLALLETRVLSRGAGSHESPVFSPDGRWIAYAATVGGRTQIRVMTADGRDDRLLTADGNNFSPDWSAYPSGDL
ncbi:MAG TPA: Tol-Pal system beta propeller repeat protein TolB [Thermoanaerobaculia bacterium]|nr:Tol-Pal system beta propeller repeat protein TolB [Thermoanaerobaculia bacterium]